MCTEWYCLVSTILPEAVDEKDDARIEIKNSIDAKLSTCEKLEEIASDDRKKR